MHSLRKLALRPIGIRLRLGAAVLMVASPLALTMVLVLRDAHDLLQQRMIERVGASARAARAEIDEWVARSGPRLQAIAARVDVGAEGSDCEEGVAGTGLIDIVELVVVADLAGNLRCASTPLHRAVSVADFRFFQTARNAPEPRASGPIRSRISGDPILPVAMTVAGPDGRPAAVIGLGLDLQKILARERAMHGFPDSILTLWDEDGEILARAPDRDRLVGRRLESSAVARTLASLTGNSHQFEAVAPDGRVKMFVAERIELPEARLWLTAGIGVPTRFGGIGTSIDTAIGLCLAILAASALLAVVWSEVSLCRPLRALAAALEDERRFTKARRVCSRSGVTELNRIGAALAGQTRGPEKPASPT